MIERFIENPLIKPQDIIPSRPDFEVLCAFNPGATVYDGQVILLLRIAERPIQEPGYISTAVMNSQEAGEFEVMKVKLDDPDLKFTDPRFFEYQGKTYLTSISHLRLAKSRDGHNFQIAEIPTLAPERPYEQYGIEDPRITCLNGVYYINYSAISDQGVVSCLAKTVDFQKFERQGIVFAPHNKDMALFPEKVNQQYLCFHRPLSFQFGGHSLWLAFSENLTDWGRHCRIIGPRPGKWDSERVGCGPAPIKTPRGWLEIYHACDEKIRYCLGALLLDLEDPRRVIARSKEPLMIPSENYEISGFVPGVVFCNGLIERENGRIDLYYGAADHYTCGATFNAGDCLNELDIW